MKKGKKMSHSHESSQQMKGMTSIRFQFHIDLISIMCFLLVNRVPLLSLERELFFFLSLY